MFPHVPPFVQWARELIGEREGLAEVPRTQRHIGRPPVNELFPRGASLPKKERNRLIRLAHGMHGCTLKEISQGLGVHYTTISKVINSDKN